MVGSFDIILRYIEQQYDDVLLEETRIKRNPKFQDHRIDALIYFIPPKGQV
jgi:cell division control protein 11